MNRHQRRKAKKTVKNFRTDIKQLAQMCDVFFQGVDEKDDQEGRHGFVAICASDKGQRAVEAVFPSAHIEWRFHDDNAIEWAEFSLNVPDCASAVPDHRLPLEITLGTNLDEAAPEALAFLMACAVNQHGARAAWQGKDGIMNILQYKMVA